MALGTPVAGAAAYSAAAGTTVAPAYPAGITAGDALVMFLGMKPSTANGGTVTTPTGWTLRDSLTAAGGYGTTIGADVGNTNLYCYTKDTVTGSETGTLSVTVGTNNVSWAFMVRVPDSGGTLSYGSADGQRTTTPTSPMAIALTNGASATNFQAGDLALWAMCIPTDVTTPSQFSAESITATGATFSTAAEFNEPDRTTGNDIGGYSAWASVTAGSSSTAPTVTATLAGTRTNVRGPVVLLRIREAQALTLDAQPDTFTLTGADATLSYSRRLSLDATSTSFTLTGADAELTYVPAATAIEFDAQPGAFTLTGQAATLAYGHSLNAASTAFTLTGQNATLARSYAFHAEAGAFTLTGQAATLTYGAADPVLNAEAGTFTLTGQAATLSRTYALHASAGAFTDALWADPGYIDPDYAGGTDAVLAYGRQLNTAAGTFTLSGKAATLTKGALLPDPADVKAGVTYGPGGSYTGTLVATGGGTVWLRRR